MPVKKVIAFGGSAGSTEPMQVALQSLPEDFPAAILIVMHFPQDQKSYLAHILDKRTALTVKTGYNGEAIQAGTVYVSQPGYHMVVIDGHLQFTRQPKVNRCRPSVDVLFQSLANTHSKDAVAVIFSGALDDGTLGMMRIKERGGICIAQDPTDAWVDSMPASAIKHCDVDYVLPAEAIGEQLQTIVEQTKESLESFTTESESDVPKVINYVANSDLKPMEEQHGTLARFACPDCGGNLWETKTNGFSQFRCHIGHAYTQRTLASAIDDSADDALWTAIRNYKEAIGVYRDLLDQAMQDNNQDIIVKFQARLNEHKKALNNLQILVTTEVTDEPPTETQA